MMTTLEDVNTELIERGNKITACAKILGEWLVRPSPGTSPISKTQIIQAMESLGVKWENPKPKERAYQRRKNPDRI